MGPGEDEQGFPEQTGDVGSGDTGYPDQGYDSAEYNAATIECGVSDAGPDVNLPKCFVAYCDHPKHGIWRGTNAFATWEEAQNDGAEHDIQVHHSIQTAIVRDVCA